MGIKWWYFNVEWQMLEHDWRYDCRLLSMLYTVSMLNMYRLERMCLQSAAGTTSQREHGQSNDRPTTRPVNLVDTKLLLAIAIANAGVNVVVVEERTLLGIPVNTLTSY